MIGKVGELKLFATVTLIESENIRDSRMCQRGQGMSSINWHTWHFY